MTGRFPGRLLAAAALGLLVAGCGLSAPGSSGAAGPSPGQAQPQVSPAPKPYDIHPLLDPGNGRKFIGIQANGEPDSLTPLIDISASIGRKPNLAGQYVAWGTRFDATAAVNAWNYGALYYMAWEPYSPSVQQIAAGASDGYITRFAKAVRALGLPIAISFGHEMNGNWYPWGSAQTPAATFVAAWRRIHDLFAAAGASNVIWVWNPNIINPIPQVQLKPYWPGAGYVDWVGLTGYFAVTGPHTFDGVFEPTMREIRHFTSKPFIIAETAVETGPDEGPSTISLVQGVASHSDVIGFVWFDYNKDGVDWRIESRPQVRADLAAAIAKLPLTSVGQ
ncbi:MAG TPA: glycosyl hydrolase [Streptosporangiaceae bacterium]|nr:glycosyl hydrolase [Streptosporangiaceae bacterium]